ncbi:MAG: nitrogenase component 1, partial [Sandaracinaceae bacterium]|nr:nitrogenase component 1 [Sandaracinaceae bacterium]
LGLNAPDESKKALRVCAAEWWGEELVLEIDGPGLRPATITIAPREDGPPQASGEAVSRGWAGAHQWRRFFASQEMDRNILRSVRLSHEAIYVEHGDLECFYSTPGFRKRVPSFINYPWPDAQAPDAQAPGEHAGDAKDLALVRDGAPMTYTSDMNESDVVLGGADKLDALIEAVSRKHKGKPIHFNCTCPPIVIADPVAPILTKIRKKHDAPVVHTTQDPGSSLHLFAAMLRGDGAEVERDPEGVNLVGFVADRGRDELVALLEAIGLRVHARLIPSAPRAEVARYGRASAQVFFPNAPFRAMYHAAFADLPLRSVHAPPPFGMQGTRRWLEVIAQDFGKQAE